VQKHVHWKIVVSTHLNKTLYRIITNEETPYCYMFIYVMAEVLNFKPI